MVLKYEFSSEKNSVAEIDRKYVSYICVGSMKVILYRIILYPPTRLTYWLWV